jgi:hypothetical protein
MTCSFSHPYQPLFSTKVIDMTHKRPTSRVHPQCVLVHPPGGLAQRLSTFAHPQSPGTPVRLVQESFSGPLLFCGGYPGDRNTLMVKQFGGKSVCFKRYGTADVHESKCPSRLSRIILRAIKFAVRHSSSPLRKRSPEPERALRCVGDTAETGI